MKLFIDGFNIFAGEEGRIAGQPHATEVRVSESVPADWTTVRLDLWKTAGKPIQLRHLGLGAKGGGMLLDRALLGRTENDLETLSNKAQPE
jgi:hypothetical protein